MTIGIYALYWEEQDLIYIGQSQNIEARFKEHLYKLKNNKHTNYKVQNTFDLYGEPQLNILETCGLDKLNNLEIFYTKEFDSINNGLNIVEAGNVGFGTNSNASKYSKIQILKVFSLLYKTSLSYHSISGKTKVSTVTISDISKGRSHTWLQEKYPNKYISIEGNNILRFKNKNIVTDYPILLSPDGKEYLVKSSLTDFCKEHNSLNHSCISSGKGIGRVLRKDRMSYLGWTLKIN